MAIYDVDQKTRRYAGNQQFLLRCDCCGEGFRCVQLQFSLWEENDVDPEEGYEVYLSILPEQYPERGWRRLKTAMQMLLFGRISYWDEMILEKRTLVGMIERLSKMVQHMKDME